MAPGGRRRQNLGFWASCEISDPKLKHRSIALPYVSPRQGAQSLGVGSMAEKGVDIGSCGSCSKQICSGTWIYFCSDPFWEYCTDYNDRLEMLPGDLLPVSTTFTHLGGNLAYVSKTGFVCSGIFTCTTTLLKGMHNGTM